MTDDDWLAALDECVTRRDLPALQDLWAAAKIGGASPAVGQRIEQAGKQLKAQLEQAEKAEVAQ